MAKKTARPESGIIAYQAKITKGDDGYSVEFPDVEGCFTCGDTLEEALSNAQEALSLHLEEALNPKWEIPRAKERRGRSYHWIIPDIDVAIALMIREARKEAHLSQSKVAKFLNMKVQQYQKLEYPRKSNPTVKTLNSLAHILGKKFIIG